MNRIWTQEEVDFLYDNLGEELGRSVTSVMKKRTNLVSVGLLPNMRNRHIRAKL